MLGAYQRSPPWSQEAIHKGFMVGQVEEIFPLVIAEGNAPNAGTGTLHFGLLASPKAARPGSLLIKDAVSSNLCIPPGSQGRSVFSNPMVTRFLKGLGRIYLQVRRPALTWDLNLVLSRLTGPPFEPLATCSLLYLSWKVSFLVAITSARMVSEFKALTSGPPYTVFHKGRSSYALIQLSY